MVDTRNYLQALTPIQSLNVLTSFTAKGVSREGVPKSKAGEGSSAPISAFQIAAVQNDYLQCNEITWDETGAGSISGDSTNVAKPHYLRVSNLGGYTNVTSNSRTVPVAGSPGIVEGLKPAYNAGDIIIASELDNQTPVVVGGGALAWEDLNVDARNWFPPYVVVNVCVGGVSRRMIVPGSPTFP